MFRIRSVLMENLSWSEIEKAIRHGYKTALVGFGAMEQHGPHLPISTDTITARELTVRAALKANNTLVAPAIPFGSSVIHRFFPGTINIDTSLLEQYLINYLDCLLKCGFDRIVIAATHGGNFGTVDWVVEHYGRQGFPVFSAYTGDEFIEFMHTLSSDRGIPLSDAGTHAGEMETAIYIYLTGDVSVMKTAPLGFTGDYSAVREEGLKKGMAYISANGVIGDARRATYENGRYYTEKLVDFIASKCIGNPQAEP